MALNFQHTDTLTSKGQADDGDTTGFDIGGAFALVMTLDVTTITGSTGTLDVKAQHSPDNSTWYDVPSGAFTQVTGTTGNETLQLTSGAFYRYVRFDYTIGAGDRVYTFNVHAEGRS